MPRMLAVPTLLVASVAVPYVATNARQWSDQFRSPSPAAAPPAQTPAQPQSQSPAKPAAATAALAQPQGPNANLFPTTTPLEGAPSYSLAEVLRMDITKDWVYQRWARKSTALAELDLFGIRVPLVSGTQLHDIAGSLTYFFGQDGRVQRISFRGRTGDTTQLASLVHQRFGLQAEATPIAGEQLLQLRRGEEVISFLRTRPSPVLWASSPHDSFSVELELQNPASARALNLPATTGLSPASNTTAAAPPATAASPAPTSAAPAQATPPAAAPEKSEPAWKAFFPRSRLPKPQVQNLDKAGLYP